jgi:hypothetical protein
MQSNHGLWPIASAFSAKLRRVRLEPVHVERQGLLGELDRFL